MELSERIYNCNNCGLQINRDLNAAINILNRSKYIRMVDAEFMPPLKEETLEECSTYKRLPRIPNLNGVN